jgi:uncharacterized membrane protein YbhN (UPF0104 family)
MYIPYLEWLIPFLLVSIISTVVAIFSPFGIVFIIFSIVRLKTKNDKLKRVSFAFQIIMTSITFLLGLLISMLPILSRMGYNYSNIINSESLILTFAILFGVLFVILIEVGIIIWENYAVKEDNTKQEIVRKRVQ